MLGHRDVAHGEDEKDDADDNEHAADTDATAADGQGDRADGEAERRGRGDDEEDDVTGADGIAAQMRIPRVDLSGHQRLPLTWCQIALALVARVWSPLPALSSNFAKVASLRPWSHE